MADLHTEEDVKVKFLLPFLKARGYKEAWCEFEKTVEIQEGRKRKSIFADVVVYSSPRRQVPLILCETKPPNEVLDRFVKEQAISYARLLPRIAPLALITNGLQVQVYQTLSKNRLPELPSRKDLDRDVVNFLISGELQEALRAEAKHGLFIIDDVQVFKNILKACHNEIRNNEGYDPTVAFDEMSKVLFCKLYEEKLGGTNRFRLAVFDDSLERLHVNVVKQIFDETKDAPAYKGLFDADAAINLQDRTIRKIVSLFENYDLSLTAFDVKGEAFEYFLGDTFTGGLGEYFTPRNIVEFMVDAVDPKIGDRIIDPFCGTGGFLIYAFEVVSEKIRMQEFADEEKARWRQELSDRCIAGTDWKERTSQACKMNMMVHGDGSAGIFKRHGLVDVPGIIEPEQFNLCLTNPPFGATENDEAVLKAYDLGAGRRSQDRMILAVERALKLVKPNGRIAIVVIDGVLNNDSTRYVREYVKKHAWVRAVVSLNRETFEGYGARAKTSVLILQRKPAPDDGRQDPVFMAIARNTGYAPNGASVPGNELPDILMDFRAFQRGEAVSGRTWIERPTDRLDAEYYWRDDGAGPADLEALQYEIAELFSSTSERFTEIQAALARATNGQAWDSVPLSDLLEETRDREAVVASRTYRQLGVRWWGGGTFVKERRSKAKWLYRVRAGMIAYNRLFAFRGSFAIVAPEHDGCLASGEFPTFVVKDGIESPAAVAKYIVHCLNSPQYLAVVDAQSTGSTKQSRNRFNQKLFLGLHVRVPKDMAALERVVTMLDATDRLRDDHQTLHDRLKKLRVGMAGILPSP